MSAPEFIIPEYEDAPLKSNSIVRWVYFFCYPFKWRLAGYLGVNTLRKLFFSLSPLFVAQAIDFVETGKAFEQPNVIWWGIGIYTGAAMVVFLLMLLLGNYRMLVDRVIRTMSLFAVRHLMKLSHNWHEASGSGGKFQQVVVARQNLLSIMQGVMWDLTSFAGSIAALVLSVTIMDVPKMFYLFYALFFAVFLYVSVVTIPRLYKYLDESRATFEKISSTVYEFVNSITTVKSFNLSKRIIAMGKAAEGEGYEKENKYIRYNFLRWVVINSTALIWVVLIVSLAYKYLLDGEISVAVFALMAFLTFQMWDQFERLMMYYTHFVEQSNGVMRLVNTLKEKSMIADKENASDLTVKKGAIEVSDLSFRYNDAVKVFEGMTLKIKGGQKIGIVGKSGAGKSTLVNLLLRFYDAPADAGSIKIDGQNIQDVTLFSLRDAISVIPQDTVMFNHSIMDNIRYGRLEASDKEVIAAAKKSYADDFIKSLPDGYETLVGERGLKLSGGQRQRIAIARAILKNSPILILDEATSALDSESETLIQKSLEDIMTGKTVVAIAHRLSTLSKMDRIIVMDEGRIIQDGTHKQLLKQDGTYKQLWETQSGGFIHE